MLLFLEKLSFERKQIMLWGGFNLNLLNYSTPRKVTQFIDEICTKYFIPYINLPKRITRKLETLIDNVCYNKIIFHSIAGNIITEISDHLIQFLIEPSTLSKNNGETNITYYCLKHFNKGNFQNEVINID